MRAFGNEMARNSARRLARGMARTLRAGLLLCLPALLCACSAGIEPVMGLRGPSRSVRAGAWLANYSFHQPQTWDLFDLGDRVAGARLQDNALLLSVGADLGYLSAGNNLSHRDVLIYARVRQTEGLLGNGFGLLCRADKAGNGYWFLISSNGEFSIQVAGAAREELFPLVPWRYHSVIRQGMQANDLRIVCADNYLAFFINDVFVAEAFDDEYEEGELAVALGAVGRAAGVSFDDIRLRAATVTGRR